MSVCYQDHHRREENKGRALGWNPHLHLCFIEQRTSTKSTTKVLLLRRKSFWKQETKDTQINSCPRCLIHFLWLTNIKAFIFIHQSTFRQHPLAIFSSLQKIMFSLSKLWLAIKGRIPEKREPESKSDTLCKASKTLAFGRGWGGITLHQAGCAARLCSKRGCFLALLHYRTAMGRDAMPAEGHSKGTVHWCCQTKGGGEAYCTRQIHLPNSSPESKKRETISSVQFYDVLMKKLGWHSIWLKCISEKVCFFYFYNVEMIRKNPNFHVDLNTPWLKVCRSQNWAGTMLLEEYQCSNGSKAVIFQNSLHRNVNLFLIWL